MFIMHIFGCYCALLNSLRLYLVVLLYKMNKFTKWSDQKPEKLERISAKKFPFPESEFSRLTSELKTLKTLSSTQLKEAQDTYKLQLDLQKSEIQSIKDSIKDLKGENFLLKDHLKNLDTKILRLEKENEELTSTLEHEHSQPNQLENPDEFQYQIAIYNEKIKKLHALLKAEKLKTLDAIREKSEIFEIGEMEKKTSDKQILSLEEKVEKEKQKIEDLKEQVESRAKTVQSSDSQNLSALTDHLGVKQRTIDNLLSEKESLITLIEAEKTEKSSLLQNKLNNRVIRQGFNTFPVLQSKPWILSIFSKIDDNLQTFTDALEQFAMIRGFTLLYLFLFHILLLIYILGSGHSAEFLSG